MNDIRAEIEGKLGKPEDGGKKIDLESIPKELVTSHDRFQEIMESDDSVMVGFDIETTSGYYPQADFSGFSVYFPNINHAVYVPLLHYDEEGERKILHPYCVHPDSIHSYLAKLIKEKVLILHWGVYDLPFLMRSGFCYDINNTVDTWVLAMMLQCSNTALKDLVLEYGLVDFSRVLRYRDLIKKVKGVSEEELVKIEKSKKDSVESVFSFSTINLEKHPEALDYACNDSIFTYHLWGEIYDRYVNWIGDAERANFIIRSQMDALVMLAYTSATGNFFDESILNSFISEYEREVTEQEESLRVKVRKAMGWA